MISKHWAIANALLTTIQADSVITDVVESSRWKIQKRFYHRSQDWNVGGYIVPIRRSSSPHENQNLLLNFPLLIGVIFPSDGSVELTEDDAQTRCMVAERLELMFCWQGRAKLPAPLRNVASEGTGIDDFFIEKCTCQPGEVYMESAFAANYDAYGLVVSFDVQTAKQDFSALGA